jgi:excisionase family DNA binding protein
MPRTKPKPKPPPAPATPLANGQTVEVMTLGEAAAYLRVAEEDVLHAVREQQLPARQVGQELRFLKPAIQHWLSTGSPPAKSNKEAWLELAGAWKDDPYLEEMLEEIYKQRGRPMVEDESCRFSIPTHFQCCWAGMNG